MKQLKMQIEFKQRVYAVVKYIADKMNFNIDDIKIVDYDSIKRVYLAINSKEMNYDIRLWNITDNICEFSFYKLIDNYGERLFTNEVNFIWNDKNQCIICENAE